MYSKAIKKPEQDTSQKHPEDMMLEELLEEIDVPIQTYLAETTKDAEHKPNFTWEHHWHLLELAEAEELMSESAKLCLGVSITIYFAVRIVTMQV